MKVIIFISAIVVFLMSGCVGNRQTDIRHDSVFTVDVTKSYPKKELILQDFMDVEYIPLEVNDEYVTTGWLHAISDEIIIVRTRIQTTDRSVVGTIYLFDRNGKGLRKINHAGEGPEEYQFLLSITLDEDNDEIFVNDHFSRKISVYDLFGKFKRSFAHREDGRGFYTEGIYNFDREHLLCRFIFGEGRNKYFVISKQDGSVAKEIEIPYTEKISSDVYKRDAEGQIMGGMPIRNRSLVPHPDNSWMLMEESSDTIYRLMPDYSMIPLLVRTPSIQSMNPGVFLYPAVFTDRYCFMQTVKAEWNWDTNTGHERVNLMYDRQENAIYECEVYNADFTVKEPVLMTSEIPFGNNEIACVHILEAYKLVEFYKKGQLTGKLKEIAAGLNEESNPVIMLVKYK
ncbi:MAG: 6-bladed beta-propeller [Tannerella sp.]|jgi:hypothetical protein|nr:6-bladed beta-propeller [Tannerella sp.]